MARELTPEQITALSAAIGDTGTLQILIDASQDDATSYAEQIAQVFTGAGWEVTTDPLPNPWFATPSGLSFMAPGDLPNSELQTTVADALTDAEVDFNRLDAMLPEGVDVKLLVGRVGV